MSYDPDEPLTGFTLTLDSTLVGSPEVIENILRAAMTAMAKEVERSERAYFAEMVELKPLRAGFQLSPPWPVRGKIQLRTGD